MALWRATPDQQALGSVIHACRMAWPMALSLLTTGKANEGDLQFGHQRLWGEKHVGSCRAAYERDAEVDTSGARH